VSTSTDDLFSASWTPFSIGSWAEPPDTVPLRILSLDQLPDNHAEVKEAFRTTLLATHPDIRPDIEAAAANTEVQELMWARDVLVRKIPAPAPAGTVTDVGLAAGSSDSRNKRRVGPNGYPICVVCDEEYPARYYDGERRWGDHCYWCAIDTENQRQRDLRAQARADRVCENVNCAGTFTPSRADGKYCSDACRQAAYRSRRSRDAAISSRTT
jgi:hypothetical protein